MTKYVVAARIDERGRATGGRAGDQSSEVNVHTLASSGIWVLVLRPPRGQSTIIRQAYAAAANNHIGYDQSQRTTLYTQAKAKKWDLSKITTNCECDCSSLVAVLCIAAGFAVSKDMYTGNEVAALTGAGFKKIVYSSDILKPGDILWRQGHTAVYVGTSKTYTASSSSTKSPSYSQNLVDVSHHNGVIDWTKVKRAGYHAILRCGYGDNMTSQDDDQFLRNAKECERLKIPYGVYLYSYAKTDTQIKSEIAHVKRLLKGRRLSYPVYFDTEQPGTERVSAKFAKKFCDAVEKAGYWAGVYASESWWKQNLKPLGDRYTKWVAKYGSNTGKPQTKPSIVRTDIWQYSSKGKVPGIPGNCDVNIVYRDLVKAVTGKSATSTYQPTKKSVDTIAKEVIAGKWGNGSVRARRLKEAGYDYAAIQRKVNELLR